MALKIFLSVIWILFGAIVLALLENSGIMLGAIPAALLMFGFVTVFLAIWGKIKININKRVVIIVAVISLVIVVGLFAIFVMNLMFGSVDNPTVNLINALEEGRYKKAEEAIRAGADVNTVIVGRPLIFGYDEDKFVNQLSFLLKHGANVNARTKYGRTPLHEAALNGEIKTVKFLIASGAKINARNNKGNTPLYYAETKLIGAPAKTAVHVKIAKLLKKHGATY